MLDSIYFFLNNFFYDLLGNNFLAIVFIFFMALISYKFFNKLTENILYFMVFFLYFLSGFFYFKEMFIAFNQTIFFMTSIFIIIICKVFLSKLFFKSRITFYSSSEFNKTWPSEIIKMIFFSEQNGKNLNILIYKEFLFEEPKNNINLAAVLSYEFAKILIKGIDASNIFFICDVYHNIRYIFFDERYVLLNNDSISIKICSVKKNISIFLKNNFIENLSPSAASRIIGNFLGSEKDL
jgi:hypothetical protein